MVYLNYPKFEAKMKEKIRNSRLLKSLKNGILAGLLIVILSFFISIVPCIKTAGVGVCSLGNPFINLTELNNKYYAISNNPMTGLIFQFLIPLFVVFVISYKFRHKKEHVVDYTKK